MKKILSILFILGAIFQSYGQLNKVAVISVFGNRNLSPNPSDILLYEKLLKDSSFNLTPQVEKFEKFLNQELVKDFPFPFLDPKEVVNAPGYTSLPVDNHVYGYNTAGGYIPILAFGIVNDTKAIVESFNLFKDKGVDGVMICYLSFIVQDQVGFGGITMKKVRAYCNIKIFNKDGKRIFKLKESELSDGGIMGINGLIVEPKKLMPHIENATEKLIVEMRKKMQKSLGKLAKKINKDQEEGSKDND